MNRPVENLTINKFDDHRWIVNTPEGRNVLINEQAAGLLMILGNSEQESEALEKFQMQFNFRLTKPEFESLVINTFSGLNILQDEQSKPYKKFSYLSLKIPLLNERLVGHLANLFKILFLPSVFWYIFVSLFILISFSSLLAFQTDLLALQRSDFVLLSLLVGSSMLIHELGHIAACRKFGIRHGEVGFGFYFIFPIVYSDITEIWKANKNQRLIANAAGIYLEQVYTLILLLFFNATKDSTFLLAAVTIFIKTVTELNPFIRYDGYWLISDITNTPNLMKKSNEALRRFTSIKNLKIHFNNLLHLRWSMPLRNSLLLSYGIINTLLLVTYCAYVLIGFHSEIIHFPFIVLSVLQKAVTMKLALGDFPKGFLWILGLYFLVFKIAFQLISKKIHTQSVKTKVIPTKV